MTDPVPYRLAIIASHPIQYYAPWFRRLAERPELQARVFYLWDFGVRRQADREFGQSVSWDVDLLAGYEHEFVPNSSGDPGTHHFWGLRNPALVDRVQAWQPDAVLVFGYTSISHLTFLLCAGRVPLLFRGDSHRLTGSRAGLRGAGKRFAIRTIFRRFQAFLPVGRANSAYFRIHGVPEEKMFSCPHAVDHDRFAAAAAEARSRPATWRQSLGIAPQTKVVLFAGKLIAKKWPDGLMDAFQSLALPDAVLVYAGSGSLEASLREKAGGKVLFLGFCNQSEMPRIYAGADLLVLPSLGAHETWGLAVNEAMACGVPCIVSSHVGCGADMVLPEKTGWIFEAGNRAALAVVLGQALEDAPRLKRMGEDAARHAQNNFHYDRVTEGLMKALKAVVPR